MLDFDKELSTFYQLLDDIETEERRLGTDDDASSRSTFETAPGGPSSEFSSQSGGGLSSLPEVGSTFDTGTSGDEINTETSRAIRISSFLSALAKHRRALVLGITLSGVIVVGISHGGTLIKEVLGLVSQSEPSTVSLTISTSPSGARVFVDGELVGVSPFEDVEISSASSVVGIVKPGFVPVDSLIDASADLALNLLLRSTESHADEASVVRTASLTSTADFSLGDVDSLYADTSDTLIASENDILPSTDAPVAIRLPTRPIEVVRPPVQFRSELASARALHSALENAADGEGIQPSDLPVDDFGRLRSMGDERYEAGLYSEAAAIYEEALRLRPGNTSVVNSIRMARAAAAIDELPSTVFSPHEAAR